MAATTSDPHHDRPASRDGPRRHAADGVRGGCLGFDDLLRTGIPVTLGGTLELTFAADVNLASQVGRTFDLFDWTGVSPSGTFAVSSPYRWDLSNLYTTGEITLVSVPESNTLLLTTFAFVALVRTEPPQLPVTNLSRHVRGHRFRRDAQADIFQWEYIDPADPSQGKQQSTTLAPDGAGVNAVPGADFWNRNLTMAYLIGADLTGANAYSANLTNADLSQANLSNALFPRAILTNAVLREANLTNADFDDATLTGADLTGAAVTGQASVVSTTSAQTICRWHHT